MTTNMDREREIRRQLDAYPPDAAEVIRWLLTETARLRDAAADEYERRTLAEAASLRALSAETEARAKVRELPDIIRAQSAEIAELTARARRLGEELAARRGQPGMVVVDG